MKQTDSKGKGATSMRPLTKAQQQLVTENIPLAMNLGKKYAGLGSYKGIPVKDLQQEACYGLCVAARRWKAHADTPKEEGLEAAATFQTYAFIWCVKFIMMAIDDVPANTMVDKDVDTVAIEEDDDEQALAEERRLKVEAMLAVLNRHEKKVVRLLYGFDGESKDFGEIAKLMHIRVARVHQIYEKARTKMEWSLS